MPPRREELSKPWKIPINAELAGQIEFALANPLTAAPHYGSRKILIEALLRYWLAREMRVPETELPSLPSLEYLRNL